MNLLFVMALQWSVGCETTSVRDLVLPESVQNAKDAQRFIRALAMVQLDDGRVTVDSKNVMLKVEGASVGGFTVGVNVATRQIKLQCRDSSRRHRVSNKRHHRGRRFNKANASVEACESIISRQIARVLKAF